jgi:hypothetical protein
MIMVCRSAVFTVMRRRDIGDNTVELSVGSIIAIVEGAMILAILLFLLFRNKCAGSRQSRGWR